MPPRKKKIIEPVQTETSLENDVENIESDLIDTVEPALTLAVEKLSDVNDVATTTANELTEQLVSATEQVVSLLTDQVIDAKEEVVYDASAKIAIASDIQNVIVVMTSK